MCGRWPGSGPGRPGGHGPAPFAGAFAGAVPGQPWWLCGGGAAAVFSGGAHCRGRAGPAAGCGPGAGGGGGRFLPEPGAGFAGYQFWWRSGFAVVLAGLWITPGAYRADPGEFYRRVSGATAQRRIPGGLRPGTAPAPSVCQALAGADSPALARHAPELLAQLAADLPATAE